MNQSEIEYTLTMNSEQAHEVLAAIELLMRLKVNQPNEITRAVMPKDYWWDGENLDHGKFDAFIARRDAADEALEKAFKIIFPTWEDMKKDAEWYCLYNILQVLRYQIHQAEHPDSTGVDSYPPMAFGGQPLPEGSWREVTHD